MQGRIAPVDAKGTVGSRGLGFATRPEPSPRERDNRDRERGRDGDRDRDVDRRRSGPDVKSGGGRSHR